MKLYLMGSIGVCFFCTLILLLAMFNWDTDKSSKKLLVDDDLLTIKVKDGSGFKTSMGDQVSKHLFVII